MQVQKLLETHQQQIFRTMTATLELELPRMKEEILRTMSKNVQEGGGALNQNAQEELQQL